MEGTHVKVEKLVDHELPGYGGEEGFMAVGQLAQAVADLCQQQANSRQSQSMVWSRPLPSISRFSGRLRSAKEWDDWVRDAQEAVRQVDLQGSEAVEYLCGFLDRPALTRVRNSQVSRQ